MLQPVPSLQSLCVDALTRTRSLHATASSTSGTYWQTAEEDKPRCLVPLPLPPKVKAHTLHKLRIGGQLTDEALLRLIDSSWTTLNISSCRSISGDAVCTCLPKPEPCQLL